MIRAIRPNAMAQDDAILISGWNVAPNIAYTLRLLPSSASCGVLLYDETGTILIATGAALAGTAQPCVLIPQTGQSVGMVDADLGWHLLLTTTGTESQRTIRLGPAVDLTDEIHPVYGDDDLAMARATAAIDAAAHYIDDVTVTCPVGLGAGLGDVVSVPVDGVAVVGQVESITWTATPDGATEQAVIRRHVAIAPEPVVDVMPPTVADDTGTATHLVGASGSVLTNDDAGLAVVAVNGLSGNVGIVVDGDNGGSFVIAADGSWTFDPDGDFALLEGSETADTSVTYHASDGTAEAMATLTVTVSHFNATPVAVDDTGTTTSDATTSGNVLTNDTDADLDSLTVSQVAGSAGNVGVAVAGSNGGSFTIGSDGAWTFDPDGDFDSLTGEDTATTSVSYHVSDGVGENEGTLTVTVSAASAPTEWTPAEIVTALWLDASDSDTITLNGAAISQIADKSGNERHAVQATASAQPTLQNGQMLFGGDDFLSVADCAGLQFGTGDFAAVVVGKFTNVSKGTTLQNTLIGKNYTGYELYNYQGTLAGWIGGTSGGASISGLTSGAWGVFSQVRLSSVHTVRRTGTTSGNFSNAVSASNVGQDVVLGRRPGFTTGWLIGAIAEVLLLPSGFAISDVKKIEGYLAHKWDALLCVTTLVDALPSDHPYKSAAPTI